MTSYASQQQLKHNTATREIVTKIQRNKEIHKHTKTHNCCCHFPHNFLHVFVVVVVAQLSCFYFNKNANCVLQGVNTD